MIIIPIRLIRGEDETLAADSNQDDIGDSLPSYQHRNFAERFIHLCFWDEL